ncbi:MAG: hypothetical protein WCP28_18535, partial [Actinomycetes bacterium]
PQHRALGSGRGVCRHPGTVPHAGARDVRSVCAVPPLGPRRPVSPRPVRPAGSPNPNHSRPCSPHPSRHRGRTTGAAQACGATGSLPPTVGSWSRDAAVVLSQAVKRERLGGLLGQLPESLMLDIDQALRIHLDL